MVCTTYRYDLYYIIYRYDLYYIFCTVHTIIYIEEIGWWCFLWLLSFLAQVSTCFNYKMMIPDWRIELTHFRFIYIIHIFIYVSNLCIPKLIWKHLDYLYSDIDCNLYIYINNIYFENWWCWYWLGPPTRNIYSQ